MTMESDYAIAIATLIGSLKNLAQGLEPMSEK